MKKNELKSRSGTGEVFGWTVDRIETSAPEGSLLWFWSFSDREGFDLEGKDLKSSRILDIPR